MKIIDGVKEWAERYPAAALTTLVLVLCVIAIVLMFGTIAEGSQCVEYGYPENLYSGGEYYCIKSVNNTDVVVPLEDLQSK